MDRFFGLRNVGRTYYLIIIPYYTYSCLFIALLVTRSQISIQFANCSIRKKKQENVTINGGLDIKVKRAVLIELVKIFLFSYVFSFFLHATLK